MLFYEDDIADCPFKAKYIAWNRRLSAVVIVEDWQSDVSPSTQSMIVFIATIIYSSLTLFLSEL